MARVYAFLLPFFVLSAALGAQAINDECVNAIPLPDDLSYCTGRGGFSNQAATPSLAPDVYPVCIEERDEMKDVWYSFTAQRNSVSLSVAGAVPDNNRGSLQAPQFALFEGTCGALQDLACRSPYLINGVAYNGGSLVYNGLERGLTYYILVGSRYGNEGSFELCLEQFDSPADPSSDCQTGVVLCDKSPFSVEALQGIGNVLDDLLTDNVPCGDYRPPELNSGWYKWTCDQPGTLSFDIIPLGANPEEDLDFTVYEMTNGLGDCDARVPIRHMYSGDDNDDVPDDNVPCFRNTGLRDQETDTVEGCGCSVGDNNYVRSIDMEAGKSYALVVTNFTQSGDGFRIEFGGTGTFLGPQADVRYSTTTACVGEIVTFEDRSTASDGIVDWEWDFGVTAEPRFASGPGPHDIRFLRPGLPSIELAVTSDRQCTEYLRRQDIEVVCCDGQFIGSADITPVSCPGLTDGAIAFSGSSTVDGVGGLSFTWETGAVTDAIDGLGKGTYGLTVTDGTTCQGDFRFEVGGPDDFVLDTLITRPTCGGGTDGALQFTVLSGGAGGYEYSFNGSPFGPNNRLENLAISQVDVVARDANGCRVESRILVDELRLERVQGSSLYTEPVCAGDANAVATLEIANGQPGYRYDFGAGYQNANSQGGLTAGAYLFRAIDANQCTGEFPVEILDPPVLGATIRADSSTCFGTADGRAAAIASGGRPAYAYAWSPGGTADSLDNLGPGTYRLTVTDSNGCTATSEVTLNDPAEVIAAIDSLEDLVCFGQPTGSVTLSATGGVGGYTYSSDGIAYGAAPLLDSLLAGDYALRVQDANGCEDTINVSLTQPEEFLIATSDFVQLHLGDDTTLLATSNYSPVDFTWGPDSVACLTPDCSRVWVRPVGSYDYFVTGVNPAGCVDTAVVAFSVIMDLPTFIPNVFSPNGDGRNDFFTVFGGNAIDRVEKLRVYDRWGGLLYEAAEPFPANEPTLGWDGMLDGRPVNNGVYVYYVEVRYINGTVERYRGDVTVLQ